MKDFIFSLSKSVIKSVNDNFDILKAKRNLGISSGGDTQFSIDDIAEEAVFDFLKSSNESIAYYSEDKGLIRFCEDPQYILIIDPIDGTRSAAAGLESCCFSVAVAKYKEDACINDIQYALLYEFKSESYFYSDYLSEDIYVSNGEIKLSKNTSLEKMFWSFEFNGHPSKIITHCIGDLIDSSANKGGVFIFNSSTYSISRIITGQLEAYIDIGNRLVKENSFLENEFRKVGNGKMLHLFPYDIAAAVYIARKAGVIITDAFGKDLGLTKLIDISEKNLQSCIAASNLELHSKILNSINWINSINEVIDLMKD
ncbi:inositol monophosphatase family protein [Clostridium sp. HBUAS56017]|uniref:inositol monophosphatase family protein n=1 Tax=Clostridium sp. HBUAS56017 TaxID=2571128 RepID=UPI00117839BC|nr:inositol monophosphatase family protein [Clostridium sp. HBUAS56017]